VILAEIQCLPTPPGTPDDRHAHVEAAIAEIEGSGVTYEVGALGTTLQGDADEVWSLLRRAHEACLTAGADSAVTVIKVAGAADPELTPQMQDLTAKFRATPDHAERDGNSGVGEDPGGRRGPAGASAAHDVPPAHG
jgi:uncharacterized protein YqgV (UPF0045/DUF77 family)